MPRRIAILGAGRLGESLLRGFLSSGWRRRDELAVTVRRPEERIDELRERYGVPRRHLERRGRARARRSSIVAVKPQDMSTVLARDRRRR